MAQPIHASLCIIVLILATLAGMGSSLQIGSVQYLDNKNAVSFNNTVDFVNGTTITIAVASLPMGTTWAYPVMDGTSRVTGRFRMANASGYYTQDNRSWARLPSSVVPYFCSHDCIWLIDEHGFSLEPTDYNLDPQFIVSWLGPF